MKHFISSALLFSALPLIAQTFDLRHDTFEPSWLSPPCFGSASECAAHSNVSFTGAGTTMPETLLNPGKGVLYIRCTDSNSNPSQLYQDFHASMNGEGDNNIWSKNNDRLMLRISPGTTVPFIFDPVARTCTRMYSGTYHVPLTISNGFWSKTQPYIWYSIINVSGAPVIERFDYSDPTGTTGPTGVQVANLKTVPNCLQTTPSFTNWQWSSDLYVSDDDQTFAAGIGDTGTGQNTAHYVVVYNRTTGCRWMDMYNGSVGGTAASGPTGNANDVWGCSGTCPVKRCGVHGINMSHDGSMLKIDTQANGGCGPPFSPPTAPWFGAFYWTINTLNRGGMDKSACGHNTQGWSHSFHKCPYDNTLGPSTFFEHSYSNLSAFVLLNPHMPDECLPSSCPNIDQHPDWNLSKDSNDLAPVFTSAYDQHQTHNPPIYYFEQEVLIIPTTCFASGNCAGVMPWRPGYTFSDNRTGNDFFGLIAVGAASSNPTAGKYYYAFTTNWTSGFGCHTGSYPPCLGSLSSGGLVDVSGATTSGTVGQTCILSNFNNGAVGSIATVLLNANGGLDTTGPNHNMTVTNAGNATINYLNPPTSATLSNGTATCSGTVRVQTLTNNWARDDVVIMEIPYVTGNVGSQIVNGVQTRRVQVR